MNPEVKKQWIKALEGGEYLQATGALRLEGRFCCLGVLCDISNLGQWEGVDGQWPQSYLEVDDYLPGQVANWAGLGGCIELDLAKLNDDGKSFKEIADYIRAVL